jgi:hypothetical protein
MSFERFEKWLAAYKHAWETRDPEAAGKIFTEDATYQVTPFQEPNARREGIMAYWTRVTTEQRDVDFSSKMLAANGDTGICRWHVTFRVEPAGTNIEIDGIFVFELTEDGLCRKFQEWWHDREY